MKGCNLRIFPIDGTDMQFNREAYKRQVRVHIENKKLTKEKYLLELSDLINVSPKTLDSWYSNSGPSDLGKIKSLANCWKMDYKLLLEEVKTTKMNLRYTNAQLDAIRRIYWAVIEFLEEFRTTNGFNDLLYDFHNKVNRPEIATEDYAMKKVERIGLLCSKEYFDLHDLEIYDKLTDYVYDMLPDTFIGKCGYAYRFEAMVENLDGTIFGTTTESDYEQALQSLNRIMEKYVW